MPEVQKVTDPAKRVTDPVVLCELARQGIDPDYVEFIDYGARGSGIGPFMKGYKDRKSRLRIAVASGLPMCNAQGRKVEVGWLHIGNKYRSKANLFSAIVKGKQVQLTCLSDQPNGAKKGDRVTYKPQLFIDGIEIINGSEPTLLPTDPTNPNYKENTLEWDYGTIAERRIRIIEGRYRDRFFVLSHPHGRVSVKHNSIGNLKLRLGRAVDAEGNPLRVTVIGDEEIIEASEFDKAVFPIEIGASLTVYPDTNGAGVDGVVRHTQSGLSWAQLVAGAGTYADDSSDEHQLILIEWYGNEWWNLYRNIEVLDSSDLPDDANISAGTYSQRGSEKIDYLSITPNINVYSSAPASNTALVAGDFNSLGSTPLCNSPISYGGFDVADYNDFVLNAAGKAAISKTSVTKLGLRNANYDVSGTPPSYSGANAYSRLKGYYVEKGAGYKPKLLITYTVGGIYDESCTDGLKVGDSNAVFVNGAALERLRPNGNGDLIQWNLSDSTHHGACSDESDATVIHTNTMANGPPEAPIDLFQLDNLSTPGAQSIQKIRVYNRVRRSGGEAWEFKTLIKTGGTIYYSDWINVTLSFVDYYTEYTQNPNTSSPWTISEINSLQAGIQSLIRGAPAWPYCICSEVWVEVWVTFAYELSCTDGLKVGDTSKGSLILNLSLTDGLKPGDSPAPAAIFPKLVSDGVKIGDTPIQNLILGLLASDGVKLGDTPSIYELLSLLVSDGFKAGDTPTTIGSFGMGVSDEAKLGDTPLAQAIFDNILSDGAKLGEALAIYKLLILLASDEVKVGDTPGAQAVFKPSLTDGVKLGEALATLLEFYPALTEGVDLGDTPISQVIFNPLVTDGAKFGDTSLGSLLLDLSLADGVRLSEALAIFLTLDLSLTDGAKLGDTPLGQTTFNPTLSDGVKLSDTPLGQVIFDVTIADGVKLSEALAIVGILNLSLDDGVKVGDVPLANVIFQIALTDGVKLGDVASYLGRILALRIITGQYRDIETITAQYRLLKAITSQYRSVKPVTAQHRLLRIFTAMYRKIKG